MSSDVLLLLISLCKDCFVVRCAEILLRIGLLDAIRLISHTLVCLSCYASVRRSSCAPVPASLAPSASANLRPRLSGPLGPPSTWPPCLCSTPACSSLLSVFTVLLLLMEK